MKYLLLLLLLLMTSCTTHFNEYQVSLKYIIDNSEPKTSIVTKKVPDNYFPGYVYDGRRLYVQFTTWRGFHSDIYSPGTYTVYEGDLNIRVVSFKYDKIRSVKVSRWDHHELKDH